MILNKSLVAANPFEKHLISRQRKRVFGKKVIAFSLMLTSMVDMFSMLVVFLLQTFSSSPEIMITKGVVLPESITSTEVMEAPTVALASDGNTYISEILVGETAKLMKDPRPLLKELNKIKNSWAKSHPGVAFPGEVNLQADEKIASPMVAKIMGILTSSSYQSIQLAVIGKR